MKVHPDPKKRNITLRFGPNASLSGRQKKLRRLPHIFPKVLELPFAADADVEVYEGLDAFRFSAPTEEFDGGVLAHAIEIYPGMTKVVVWPGGGGGPPELRTDELELDRWRFRLPESTRPALATADYIDGELVVTVPKDSGRWNSGEDESAGQ